MLRGIDDLKHLTIAANDGPLGNMSDFYFDDRSWAVCYLEIDTGAWLPGRRVLVAPMPVRSPDPSTVRVALSKAQIKFRATVSPRHVRPVTSGSQGDFKPASLPLNRETGTRRLQTASALIGYAVQTEDGEIGHVKDVLVDDSSWTITYLVIDTGDWLTGQTVMVSPKWLTRVRWDESKTLFCIATAIV